MSPMQKQRLIGAVVLVALGVIIVPMLFDFSREGPVEMQAVDIPPAPDVMRMEVLPLDDWSQKADPGIDKPEPVAVVAESVAGAVESAEPIVPAAVPVEEVATEPPPSVAKAPVAVPPVPPVVKPAPVVVPVAPALTPRAPAVAKKGVVAEGWILQIASLTVESKANDLRDRLRVAGHPVFIEYGKSAGSAIYRVKAGPVASRTAADDLKVQVKQKTGLDGLVMQYP